MPSNWDDPAGYAFWGPTGGLEDRSEQSTPSPLAGLTTFAEDECTTSERTRLAPTEILDPIPPCRGTVEWDYTEESLKVFPMPRSTKSIHKGSPSVRSPWGKPGKLSIKGCRKEINAQTRIQDTKFRNISLFSNHSWSERCSLDNLSATTLVRPGI